MGGEYTQVEVPSRYVQTVPHGKCLCPDPPRRKVPMSRQSCVNFSCNHRAFKRPHVQTFVRSKLPMSRLSCVPKENSCAPKSIICAFMSRLSGVQKCLSRLLCDFSAFKMAYFQTFECSKPKFAIIDNKIKKLTKRIILDKFFNYFKKCIRAR